jgi:tight adherence protein B
MRRGLLALAAAAALLSPVAATAGAQSGFALTQATGAKFPTRIFTLSLPKKTKVTAANLSVTENGRPVSDIEVIPAEAAERGAFGIVLVIDASNSMRGAPIRGAVDAARAFLGRRAQNQQVAIVTFNRETHVVQSFSTDPAELNAALAKTPALAEGTHLYDGVRGALDLLANDRVTSGSIVVLSDGADTGSTSTLAAVSRAAQQQHARVFTIGLRSAQYAPDTLRRIATSTDGTYAEAKGVAGLARIYRDLAGRLSREYLVHYRSLAGPGAAIRVSMSVSGLKGSATTTYRSPALPLKAAPPYKQSAFDSFLQSPVSMLLVALAAALLVSGALALMLQPSGRALRRRVSEFVSISSGHGRDGAGVADRVFSGTERGLERTKWWGRFKELVELSEIKLPPVQIVLWTLVGTIFLGWLTVQLTGAPYLAVAGLLVPVVSYEVIARRVAWKRRLFADQLPDNLQVVASALRAGHSLVGAMSVVVEDAPEPTKSEFRRVIADERLGVPLEDALEVVVERMKSRELAQVALVAALQRRTGGNSAEVLDRVVELIRERAELRRLVRTLTAQGRLSRWILTALPLVLFGVIMVIAPGYMTPLLESSGGRVLLVVAGIMILAGSFVIAKIVDIKV